MRPQTGDKIAEIVFGILDTPQDLRERMKAALQPKAETSRKSGPPRNSIGRSGNGKPRERMRWLRLLAAALSGMLILRAPVPRSPIRSPISTRASRSALSCARSPAATTTNTRGCSRASSASTFPAIRRSWSVNMPGGGGITAANYMAQVAPRDGTVIGIVSQGLAVDQALGAVAAAEGRSARVQLDRQRGLFQPVAGGLAHLADQDDGGRQAARDDHRHDRRRLGVGAVPGVLQQCAGHEIQDRVRLSRRPAHRSRDGARRGRRAGAPIPIPAGWRRSRPGFPRRRSSR